MIGRPYRPTDIDNEFAILQFLGYPVRATDENGEEVYGVLANVEVDGTATLEHDGFCAHLVRAETVRPNLSGSWSERDPA